METTAFVILHYGAIEITDICVQSILRMEHQELIQIVLVDNELGKPETHRRHIAERYEKEENITVLTVRENGGFSHANNLGYRYAREVLNASFIVVLNNDIEFIQRDFILKLGEAYEAYRCHIIAPDIVRLSTGAHQNPMDTRLRTAEEAEYTIRMNRKALKYYDLLYPLLYWNNVRMERRLTKKGKLAEENLQTEREGIIPFGACLIFTPAFVMREETAFTPETQFYYEEYILAHRCQKNGYKIIYTPELLVFHESGAATRRSYRSEKARLRFVMERTVEACGVYLGMVQGD